MKKKNLLKGLCAATLAMTAGLTVVSCGGGKGATSFTVSYESNGGTAYNTATVDKDSTIYLPTPTKSGYVFDGWFTDAEFTTPFTNSTKVTENLTLYAKWTQQLTVTFNSNGGTAVVTQNVKAGSKVTKPANPSKTTVENKYQKTTYSFDAWYKDETLTEVFDFNTALTANITLYAKWNESVVPNDSYMKAFAGIRFDNFELTSVADLVETTVGPFKIQADKSKNEIESRPNKTWTKQAYDGFANINQYNSNNNETTLTFNQSLVLGATSGIQFVAPGDGVLKLYVEMPSNNNFIYYEGELPSGVSKDDFTKIEFPSALVNTVTQVDLNVEEGKTYTFARYTGSGRIFAAEFEGYTENVAATSIEVESVTKNFNLGDTFSSSGIAVRKVMPNGTYTYANASEITIDSTAVNMDKVGTYNVKVKVGTLETTYEVKVEYKFTENTTITFGTNGNYESYSNKIIDNTTKNTPGGEPNIENEIIGSFKFDVSAGAAVTISGHSGYTNYSINGKAVTDAVYTYIASASETITIETTQSYIKSIDIKYLNTITENTTITFGSEGNYEAAITNNNMLSTAQIGGTNTNNSQIKDGYLIVKVNKGATVSVTAYNDAEYVGYTITNIDGTVSDVKTGDYSVTASTGSGYVIITPTKANNYLVSISVTYPTA